MSYELRYSGHSGVYRTHAGTLFGLSPNLARERVAFDAELRDPIRFREAMSALHAVVVGDYRVMKKDRSGYRAWKAQKEQEERDLRAQLHERAKLEELAKHKDPPPPNLEADFRRLHRRYWQARVTWANELARRDPQLFRHLVPCNPVITVAPDVVFFEGFAKDESSYGCLYVDRDAFASSPDVEIGTTNVDYSLALYEHFQTLRTYRRTRLCVDPKGFDVAVEGQAEYREEKIDLPPSWLRGFGQISAATGLPSVRVDLPVAAVYALLAYLRRHREKAGPRSLRFELAPGRPAVVHVNPFGVSVTATGSPWHGNEPQTIKVWGRRRLAVLARLLPIAAYFEVHLLGSGLPSIWVAHLGAMRFVLALSGWTTNDWTGGAQLDLLAGEHDADPRIVASVEEHLRRVRSATLDNLVAATSFAKSALRAALHALAKRGQLVHDYTDHLYRYRSILDAALGESLLGPEPPELVEGRRLFGDGDVRVERSEPLDRGRTLFVAKVKSDRCEAIFDADGKLGRARCGCSHHHRFGTRKGPCRHLVALRFEVVGAPNPLAGRINPRTASPAP